MADSRVQRPWTERAPDGKKRRGRRGSTAGRAGSTLVVAFCASGGEESRKDTPKHPFSTPPLGTRLPRAVKAALQPYPSPFDAPYNKLCALNNSPRIEEEKLRSGGASLRIPEKNLGIFGLGRHHAGHDFCCLRPIRPWTRRTCRVRDLVRHSFRARSRRTGGKFRA